MDYQNNNDSAHESNVAKKRHSPAELKASKRDLIDRPRSEESDTTLPEPTFRQVPVHVTRRTGPQIAPLPPPRNTKDSEAQPKRRVSNRKQKRRLDGGEGSDSDSERDELKQGADEVPLLIKTKKNAHEDGSEVGSPSHETALDTKFARQMKSRAEQRQIQNDNEIKWRLIDFRRNNFECLPLNQTLICNQERLFKYLDTTKGTHATAESRSLEETVEDTIYRTERALLIQCSRFDDLESSGKSQDLRLLDVLGKALRALSMFHPFVTRYEAYTSNFPEPKPHSVPYVFANGSTRADVWAIDNGSTREGYWADVLRRFRAAYRIASHLELARPIGRADMLFTALFEGFWDKVIFAMCQAAMSMPMHEAIDTTLLETIGQSRQDGGLVPSYLQWMTRGVDVILLRDLDWYPAGRSVRDRARAVIDGSVETSEVTVSLEFCSDFTGLHTTSLVSWQLNGDIKRIETVSDDEFNDFGWTRETPSVIPWRCEPVGDGRDVLKVDETGIILGVFGLKRGTSGTSPLDWVFVPATILDTDPAEASSLPRQISMNEMHSLGLPMASCLHRSTGTCFDCACEWYAGDKS